MAFINKKSNSFKKNIRQERSTQFCENLSPVAEHNKYNISLYQTNRFNYEHTHQYSSMENRVLSFSFRTIEFNKKRSLLFFLALELLTGKKPIATTSSKNVQSWKIRKDRLVGCKVTLRQEAFYSFVDTLALAVPRREKLSRYSSKISKKQGNRTIRYPPSEFRFGELVLFHPIEVGIGLHQDLQYLHISCVSNSYSAEERRFHLRAFQFPF